MADLIVDSVLTNGKAYMNKTIMDCSIAINNDVIFKIGREANMPKADTRIDLKSLLVLPGLIDVHVHLRDEGKAYKEDFYSGTAAAAAGGITTVFDMPNNDPVTMSVGTLRNRLKIAEEKVLVNVGFYSEFPKNTGEIGGIVKEGCVGFKLFLANQVGGLNIRSDHALLEAFKIVGESKVPIALHAEDVATLKEAEDKLKRADRNDIDAFLLAHSENAEEKSVRRVLNIGRQANVRLHFCHTSTRGGLEAMVDAKKSGMPITCEVTPHHLFLSVGDLRRVGTLGITMPPVREKGQITALWDGVRNGWVDVLASDHAPHSRGEKEAESVWDVKVGIPGLETTLPLLLTEVRRGRLSVGDIVVLMSENPAKILKLGDRGQLREGSKADLTVIDLHRKYKIDASQFHSKANYSPFDGWMVEGKPVKTFVGGQLIVDEGEIVAKAGSGEIIRRE